MFAGCPFAAPTFAGVCSASGRPGKTLGYTAADVAAGATAASAVTAGGDVAGATTASGAFTTSRAAGSTVPSAVTESDDERSYG